MATKTSGMVKFFRTSEKGTNLAYAKSGVDLQGGDDASKKLYSVSKKTWSFRNDAGRISADFDDFTGLRYISISNLKNIVIGSNSDGIGTKAEIAERLGKFDTLGFDLLAMVCDDAVVRGGEPIAITNVLDVNAINSKAIGQIAAGLKRAAKSANVGIINGELAELGEKVGGYGNVRLNWSASCLWFADKYRLLNGKHVRPKQSIVALREYGFRSNGLSLVRKVMERGYGEKWHDEARKLSLQILRPSSIYAKFAASLFGGYAREPIADVSAMANITGGGVPGKLARALKPLGLGAVLDDLFNPPDAMLKVKELGEVRDIDAYRTWNMGNGFMIVTSEPEIVISHARKYGIEARLAGTVVKSKGIRIIHDAIDFNFL